MTEEKEIPESNEQKEIPESNEQKPVENVADNQDDETELESAIIRQVEYYFGDANIPRDKFLREQIQLDDGWVPLEVLTRFNRLSKLSPDTDVIAKALLKSTSGLLEVSEDNKKVRRHPELPVPELNEERRKELMNRTLYIKGFPKETTLDEILAFLKQYEDVEHIVMRKYQQRNTTNRIFKGSVFVQFKTKEQAEKFLALKELKYNDTLMLVLWQDVYIKQKQEEYTSRKEQKDKKHKDKEQNNKPDKEEFKLPTGCVLHFSQGTDKMKREDIRDALTPLGGEISYIDFKVGDTEGWVRFTKENSAKEVAEKLTDGKVKISEADVVFKLLEGDEEKAYLDKTIEEMVKRRRNMKQNKFNKGKNFKGNRGQGRKRKQDNHDDAPARKVKADS